jgi:signal transduction histidine kinase
VVHARRLHLRFAAATLAVIATAGAALLWSVQHEEVRQSDRAVGAQTQYIAKAILKDELVTADLEAPVTGNRRAQLDWLFENRVLLDGGLRVKLYRARDGLVTYSNVSSLIGQKTDELDKLREALAGRTLHDVGYLNQEGGPGKDIKALEVYTPLTLRDQTKPSGVFELYQSYAPVAANVHSFLMPFALLLLATLLGMWAALFPLVNWVVRTLERSRTAQQTTELALEETAEQLRQSQKMEAIGRLAGGVAHDFNNLLLAINGYTELLSSTLTDPRQQRYADEIHAAGDRAAGLTTQLLAFSRRQVLAPQVLDLNDAVREIDSMLRRLIGEGVHMVLDLDPDLGRIEADPSQIGQVLLNLAVNARDAMDGSGMLKISTWNDAGGVVLEVADTGVGMDAETQSHMFEPFFTTKGVGSGTGLGLSTVYGVVAQSGGTISVRSVPGHGATFVLRFPTTTAKKQGHVGDTTRSGDVGGERILVVDDEEVVRDLLAQLLDEQGYEVCVAESATDALAMDETFDLLLTDVVMPDIAGTELARSVDARHVLFMSGYDQQMLVEANMPFLAKPFGRDELARAVRDVLDAGRLERTLV